MMKFFHRSIPIILCLIFLDHLAFSQFGGLDKTTIVELNEDRTSGQTKFFKTVSRSTGPISVGIPLTLLVVGEINSNKSLQRKAVYIGESIVVSSAITWGLKYSINRQRPQSAYPGEITAASTGGSPSFPSGHTSQAFATATALSIAFPKWYVVVPAMGWAATVAYSRMYLGVHYPSDVVAGALVGMGSAWITNKANEWIQKRHLAKKPNYALY